MLYINQREYPYIPYPTHTAEPEHEDGKKRTLASAGCGICAGMMVVDRLLPNVHFTKEEAIGLSFFCDANAHRGTLYRRYAPALCKKFNLRYEESNDFDDVLRCLHTGGCVVCVTSKRDDDPSYVPTFTYGGHYIVLINEEPDGRICILDPSLKEGKFEENGRSGRVEVKGNLCFCSRKVIEDDTVGAGYWGHYFLFWRA